MSTKDKVALLDIRDVSVESFAASHILYHMVRKAYSCSRGTNICDMKTPDVFNKIRGAIRAGHMSILEHVNITFAIRDAPIFVLRHIMRHRIASYTERSMRFTKAPNKFISMDIAAKKDFSYEYEYYAISEAYERYLELTKAGIRKEVARTILPQSMCVPEVIMTMNARSLFNLFKLRLAPDAQYETRVVVTKMLLCCIDECPELFGLASLSAHKIKLADHVYMAVKDVMDCKLAKHEVDEGSCVYAGKER